MHILKTCKETQRLTEQSTNTYKNSQLNLQENSNYLKWKNKCIIHAHATIYASHVTLYTNLKKNICLTHTKKLAQ